MNPLISIIVPVYNTAEYIEECIQSILSQSYNEIELILVNDGSTDGSGEICKKYENLPYVQYIEKKNAGVVEARKLGVESANGKWIMFVDSDDYLLKDGVRELLSAADGVDIVIGPGWRSTSLNDAPEYFESKEYLRRLYNKEIDANPWAKLFRRELFERSKLAFAYNYPPREDFLMNLAIARVNDKRVAVWKKPIYFYRIRQDSAIHISPPTLDYLFEICKIADSLVADTLTKQEMNQERLKLRYVYYIGFLKNNNYKGEPHHPFVRGILKQMNCTRGVDIFDRLIFSLSDRKAIKACFSLKRYWKKVKMYIIKRLKICPNLL